MGGRRFPNAKDGSYQFDLSQTLSLCEAVASGDAADSCLPDPTKIIAKPHVGYGHSSAHQLKRVLVGSDGATMGLINFADEGLQ